MSNTEATLQFVGTFSPVNEPKEILDTITIIAGRLNNACTTFYWQIDEDMSYSIGDYAIVENMQGYDLVKIVGIVETTKDYARFITNSKTLKKVVQIIDKEEFDTDE